MSEINDGGPAFPYEERDAVGMPLKDYFGITMRDYFAAKALQGMLADLPNSLYGLDWVEKTAKSAYAIADAMLVARTQGDTA